MKKTIIILLLFTHLHGAATTYHVAAQGGNYTTLAQVQSAGNTGTIKPGDSVLFRCGDSFTGNIYWATVFDGKSPSNVYFGSYGTGAKPYFEVANTGVLFYFVGVNNITVSGLSVGQNSFPVTDKTNSPKCQSAFTFGSDEASSNYCSVSNCDITNVGGGVVLQGSNNTVSNCNITDLKNIKNTPGGDDDYGANGVTLIYADNNLITHNNFIGCWANSYDYGWNGGALEMFQSCSNNRTMYNSFTDCDGIAEFGAYIASTVSSDNLFAYNLIKNCGQLSWCNLTSSFATNVNNVQYYNNVIISDANTRFTDATECFAYNGSPSSTIFDLKNNIFLLDKINVVRSSSVSNTAHSNNIYDLINGSKTNYSINSNEANTTVTLVDGNYYPLANSPVINFGTPVGIDTDFDGNKIIGNPDAGVKEFVNILGIDTTHTVPLVQQSLNITYSNNVISFRSTISGDWVLYDITGRAVLNGRYRNGSVRINISHVASGIYIFKTINKNGYPVTTKIVKT